MHVLVLGTAGSGKTTLVASYAKWLRENAIDVAVANLDPGAETLPYEPDFDIREFITLEQVMRRYKLGPNGAMIKAVDLMLELGEVIANHPAFSSPNVVLLIDTPGQMELFVYRESGRAVASMLKARRPTVGIYLVDGGLVSSLTDLVISWLTGLVVQLKLDIPVIPVINKADLIRNDTYAKLLVTNPEELIEKVESSATGMLADTVAGILKVVAESRQALRLVFVSATRGYGLDELHSIVHEALCACGDLT